MTSQGSNTLPRLVLRIVLHTIIDCRPGEVKRVIELFAEIVAGIDGSMVIEYAQRLLPGPADGSIVNRLFLGGGKTQFRFESNRNRCKILTNPLFIMT